MEFKGPRCWRCSSHGTWFYEAGDAETHAYRNHHGGRNGIIETWDRCAVCGLWVCVADARQHACTEAQGPALSGLVLALLGVVGVVLGAVWLMGGGR